MAVSVPELSQPQNVNTPFWCSSKIAGLGCLSVVINSIATLKGDLLQVDNSCILANRIHSICNAIMLIKGLPQLDNTVPMTQHPYSLALTAWGLPFVSVCRQQGWQPLPLFQG